VVVAVGVVTVALGVGELTGEETTLVGVADVVTGDDGIDVGMGEDIGALSTSGRTGGCP
jgi:hypothetical protein